MDSLLLRRRLMVGGDTYLDASYITFTGEQYIDLGIYGNSDTQYIIDFDIAVLIQGQSRSFFGYYDTDNPTTKSLSLYLGYGAVNTRYGNASGNLDWRSGHRYTAVLSPSGMYVERDGSLYYNKAWSPSPFTTNGTLKVGYTGTGLWFIGNVNSIEVRNIIGGTAMILSPVYSVRLKQYGLLEQRTRTFYYSVTGVPLGGELLQ